MKLEQACRFRTTKKWEICARSEGFTAENEKSLGSALNDSMNPLFNGCMGRSELVYTHSGDDMLLAKCTMLTDINGRPSIFTHTYVMPHRDYVQLMETRPEFLLTIDVSKMMEYDNGDSILPQAEITGHEMDLDAIRVELSLTDEDYAWIICAANNALTSNDSLCLITDSDDKIELVRKMAYCVAKGIIPALRGNITLSSACDLRQNISVQGGAGGRIGSGAIPFVCDPTRRNYADMDPLLLDCGRGVVAAGAYRESLLVKMQQWMEELCGDVAGISPYLIAVAYYMVDDGTRLTSENAAAVLRLLLQNQQESDFYRSCVATVLRRMPASHLAELTEEQAGELYYLLCKSTQTVVKDTFVTLLPSLRENTYDGILRRMLDVVEEEQSTQSRTDLTGFVQSGLLSMETVVADTPLVERLLRLTVQQNIEELLDFCVGLLHMDPEQLVPYLEVIIAAGPVRGCCAQLMQEIIQEILEKKPRNCLASRRTISVMDAAVVMWQDCSCMNRYFFEVEIVGLELSQQYALLVERKNDSQRIRANQRVDYLARHRSEYAELYEYAWAKLALVEPTSMDWGTLAECCKQYNDFMNPEGYFEKTVVELWQKLLQCENIDPEYLITNAGRMVQQLAVSKETRVTLRNLCIADAYSRMQLRELLVMAMQHRVEPVALEVMAKANNPELIRRRELCCRFEALHATGNAEELLPLFNGEQPLTTAEKRTITELVQNCIEKGRGVPPMDLLVLLYLVQQKGEWTVDLQRLLRILEYIDRRGLHLDMKLEESKLLERFNVSYKDVKKLAGKDPAPSVMQLLEYLKPDKKQFNLGSAFGGLNKLVSGENWGTDNQSFSNQRFENARYDRNNQEYSDDSYSDDFGGQKYSRHDGLKGFFQGRKDKH